MMRISLILAFFLLILHHSNSQVLQSGSTLTAGDSDPLLSSSGDFAFGFYPASANLFLVGIWFNKIQETTLIWSANRDSPAETGSTLSLTSGGQLVLNYANGTVQQIYSGAAAARSGIMQDDGNFVLKDSGSGKVWESFSSPTDTVLPGQSLGPRGKLFSNSNAKGDFNHSRGEFMLEMQGDGKLVLSAFHFADIGYWVSSQDPQGTDEVILVFDQRNASLYLVKGGNNIFSFPNDVPTPVEDYYHRATLDSFGNFQRYAFHKTNGSNWIRVWKIPSEPCMVNAVCGAYGYCTSNDNETVNCDCLPGYIFLDPTSPTKGCHPETIVNFCADISTDKFRVEAIKDIDMPYKEVGDYESYPGFGEEECNKVVMEDCYAMAASLVNGTCSKKRTPILNARKTSMTKGSISFIKVPVNSALVGVSTKKNPNTRAHLTAGLIITSSLAVLFGALALYYHPAPRRLLSCNWLSSSSRIGINFREFTYKELHEATNGFSKQLGKGASGKVYFGILNLKNVHVELAVKQMDKVAESSEKTFMTELKIIGRTHHKNLVKLLGFCIDDKHFLLVYEFMKNGALSDFLFKEGMLPTWSHRSDMALGIARGLLYLHEECDTAIIHCDIKPQNVLLDSKYSAKISDFGLSKLLNKDQTRTETGARGTVGYLAPEWLKNAPITPKVDVFSFGIMLLEITCGRRHIELNRVEEESEEEEDDEGDDLLLTKWVAGCVASGRIDKLARRDPQVLDDITRFERFILVGLWCIHPDPIHRPQMKMVTQMLQGTIKVGVPPMLDH